MSTKPEQPLRVGEWCYLPAQDKLVKLDNQGDVIETAELDNLCQKAMNYLLANAGRLITRDELLNDVWGVRDVSDGRISRVIRVLRVTLGDDTKEPRYIETIPKRGFRFIAPIEVFEMKATAPEPVMPESTAIVQAEIVSTVEQQSDLVQKPTNKKRVVLVLVLAILLSIAAVAGYQLTQDGDTTRYSRFTPLSSLPGSEQFVDATGDGKYLVYVYRPANSPEEQLILQQRNNGRKTQLMKVNGELLSGPQFSPDGLSIVYQRQVFGQSCEIRQLTLDEERRVVLKDQVLTLCNKKNFRSRMSWSPDGKYLVYQDFQEDSQNIALMLYPFSGGKVERLTLPPATSRGDILAVFASDSDHLAFVRDVAQSTGQIWMMSLTEREPKMLYQPKDRYPAGLAWIEQDTKLLFPGARHQINQLDVRTLQVSARVIADAPARDLVTINDGTLIGSVGENWQVRLTKAFNPLIPGANLEKRAEELLSDSMLEINPISGKPDAFVSRRSGLQTVYLRYSDGTHLKLAEFASDFFISEFDYSSDGERLLVGHANNLWVLEAGKEPIRINKSGDRVGLASWAADSKTVYFFISRQGHWLLQSFKLDNGATAFLSDRYDFYQESPDGSYKAWRDSTNNSFYIQKRGESAVLINLKDLVSANMTGIVCRANGIYYPMQLNSNNLTLGRFNVSTGIVDDTKIPLWGAGRLYSVSHDEKVILHDTGRFGDIDIAENSI